MIAETGSGNQMPESKHLYEAVDTLERIARFMADPDQVDSPPLNLLHHDLLEALNNRKVDTMIAPMPVPEIKFTYYNLGENGYRPSVHGMIYFPEDYSDQVRRLRISQACRVTSIASQVRDYTLGRLEPSIPHAWLRALLYAQASEAEAVRLLGGFAVESDSGTAGMKEAPAQVTGEQIVPIWTYDQMMLIHRFPGGIKDLPWIERVLGSRVHQGLGGYLQVEAQLYADKEFPVRLWRPLHEALVLLGQRFMTEFHETEFIDVQLPAIAERHHAVVTGSDYELFKARCLYFWEQYRQRR